MADTIRTHLSTKHSDEWCKVVVLERLKGYEKIDANFKTRDTSDSGREAFTMKGFLERLARWITVDDQVSCICFDSL